MLPVIADLETIAHPEAAAYLPPPELEYLTAPKNYTKPETIEQWKVDEKARRIKQWEDDLERCALDPDLNRIVAIGYMRPRDEDVTVITCQNEIQERAALEQFWTEAKQAMLIGYNFAGFDAPTLMRRSLLLGVKAPGLYLSKYKHPSVVDVMKILSFDNLLTFRKQSFYLKRFGLDVPKDDLTGADIALAVHEGRWDAIEHHVRCDVLGTRALAAHIGLIPKREPVPEAVR